MQNVVLGNTGINVSRLCFGSLTLSPLQAKLSPVEGAGLIKAAQAHGVNFLDTAELYNNYESIRLALAGTDGSLIVSSKSYAYTYEDMQQSVELACRSIGRDYIDIFCLHEQISRMTLKGHGEAIRFLVEAKQKGLIRAVGVSTHTVEVVKAAAMIDEIDVIHPILNYRGIGILDGSVEDMLAAIHFAKIMGKGLYSMKALGGGHLIKSSEQALAWILQQPDVDAVAVGMQSQEEVKANCAFFAGTDPGSVLWQQLQEKKRHILVDTWCQGCGTCAKHCPMQAITIINGKAKVNEDKCVLCGYCGAHCPEFCIKII